MADYNTQIKTDDRKVISFTVAECSEFHNMGELHENVHTASEAIELYKAIPPERMNGIPSIGIRLSDVKNPEEYSEMDILVGKTIDMDTLLFYPEISENWSGQKAIAALIHDMPDAKIEGKIPDDIQKKINWLDAQDKRQDEMKDMTEKLEKGVKDVFQGENFKKYLDLCSRLPRYSINNQILIMLQKPEATMCQSFTGWKDMKRFVKKGEKGIRILAPSPYKIEREQEKVDESGNPVLDADGEPMKEKVEIKVNAFKAVSTFDISQTEGEPVPQLGVDELTGSVEGYETLFTAIKEASPVPITFENIESGAKGYYHTEQKRIAIQEGMSEAQTVKTALHEASHAMLHSKESLMANNENKSKNQKECEAESVAYVVSQHYGIDTSEYSFPYVAGWSSDKDVPELKASLNVIRSAAAELITKIDDKIAELTQSQDINKFAEIDQWIAEHGEELPFDNPEGNQNIGYVEIIPPVTMVDMTSAKVRVIEESEDKDAGIEKKCSVKKMLADNKEKVASMPKKKQVETKNLGEAI